MPPAKDEVARRTPLREDPRVEPVTGPVVPPTRPTPEEKAGLREEMAPRVKRRDPRAESDSVPAMAAVRPEAVGAEAPEAEGRASAPEAARASTPEAARASTPEAPADVAAPKPPPGEARPAPDPRLVEIDRLLDRTAWKEIADQLGPPEKAGELTPALALVYALARREAAGDDAARGATELAIKSMAALLGVAPDSAAALVLAKRLLRQNPASWRTRPAPPAKLSVAIILIGIALGVGAGSFLSLSAFHKLF